MAFRKSKRGSMIKKRVSCNNNNINFFPKELLTTILARVASKSPIDLFRAKQCCKQFLEAASEDYVYEHVSIKQFPIIPWRKSLGASLFWNRCLESGNPETLFRKGLVEFFQDMLPDSGLEYLKRAAKKGHVEATYVYGIVLVCYEANKEEGFKILSSLKSAKLLAGIKNNVKRILWYYLWINNHIVGRGPDDANTNNINRPAKACECNALVVAQSFSNRSSRRSGWDTSDCEEDEAYDSRCDYCFWGREANLFLNMLRTGRFKPYNY